MPTLVMYGTCRRRLLSFTSDVIFNRSDLINIAGSGIQTEVESLPDIRFLGLHACQPTYAVNISISRV